MSDTNKALLVKEIAYRASRRGTKELDTKLKPFTNTVFLETLPEETLLTIKTFLLESEMTLMAYLIDGIPLPEGYERLKQYFNL